MSLCLGSLKETDMFYMKISIQRKIGLISISLSENKTLELLFLRLENVGQLSLIKLISSHGNITRSAHLRGTGRMAEICIDILNKNSDADEQISEIQSLAIQVATLLHDVGHGPYSHLFQTAIINLIPNWNHEDQSIKIVRYIMEKNDVISKYSLPADFADAVCDMIKGISKDKHKAKYSKSSAFNRFVIFTIANQV
jgi:HD superfamily phosphohydrolase